MDGRGKCAGPGRASRSDTGKTKHGGIHDAAGSATGKISGTPIAAAKSAGSRAWNDVGKSKSRMGKNVPTKTQENRWEKLSHNPSGAANIPDLGRGGRFADYSG